MRIAGEDVEEKLFERETARGWKRSGLISAEQLAAVESALGPLPAQAGWAVRLLLFGFAWTAANSLVSFFAWVLSEDRTIGFLVLLVNAGLVYYLAERVITTRKLYRFGAEEGLVIGSLFQLCAAILCLIGRGSNFSQIAFTVGGAAAVYLCWTYLRFGYLYAAFGAVAALSLAASSWMSRWSEGGVRLFFVLFYAALLTAGAARRTIPNHDAVGWKILQSFLVLLICLFANLRLEAAFEFSYVRPPDGGLAYWASFVFILAAPAAVLVWALRRRERPMMSAAFIAAVLGLVSVKPYLGLARHSWDPAVLGAVFMGLSLYLKRRLDDGGAAGWTAKPLIVPRADGPEFAALLAAIVSASGAPLAKPEGFKGAGGSSGGAGASGGF